MAELWNNKRRYFVGDEVTVGDVANGTNVDYMCITEHNARSTFDATEATNWKAATQAYINSRILYGTGVPPSATGKEEGTLYFKYTA